MAADLQVIFRCRLPKGNGKLRVDIFSFHFSLSMKHIYASLLLSKGVLNECAHLL